MSYVKFYTITGIWYDGFEKRFLISSRDSFSPATFLRSYSTFDISCVEKGKGGTGYYAIMESARFGLPPYDTHFRSGHPPASGSTVVAGKKFGAAPTGTSRGRNAARDLRQEEGEAVGDDASDISQSSRSGPGVRR